MFGTQLHMITFVFLGIEILFLLVLLAYCLSRPKDKTRTRFFVLTLFFIFYNLASGLLPDDLYPIPFLVQNILAYGSGIGLATYYFYYLVKELNIEKDKFFNPKILLMSLTGSFLIGFVFTYLLTENVILSKYTFIVFPVIIALFFCVRTVRFIMNKTNDQKDYQAHHRFLMVSSYLGITFMATMPIVVAVGDYQSLNTGLVNISFVLAVAAFVKGLIYQNRMEYNALLDMGYFYEENQSKEEVIQAIEDSLTDKETEVAMLMLKNLTYREISEQLYIAERTASKHASNIFKKTECRSKKEFIERYGEVN